LSIDENGNIEYMNTNPKRNGELLQEDKWPNAFHHMAFTHANHEGKQEGMKLCSSMIANLGKEGNGAMTIQESRALKTKLQKSFVSLIDSFQKKTGLTVEEINISHNGVSAEDHIMVDVKTYL
jgi:hypothetical protein